MVSALHVWCVLLFDSHDIMRGRALCSRAVDGLGVASRFIVVVVVGFGGPECFVVPNRSCKDALDVWMSLLVVVGGAGRLVVALGVGAFDGLGDDGRFIGVGFVGNCSMSSGKLLLFHCSLLIAQFGSLRAS